MTNAFPHSSIDSIANDTPSGTSSADNFPVLKPAEQTTGPVESWTEVQRHIEQLCFVDDRSLLQDLVERAIALAVLVLCSPLLLAMAIYIRLDSPGAPVFSHFRVGKNGKLFRFYKFRTLYSDAKQRFPEWYSYRYTPQQLQDLQFKVEADPRITRAGRLLRKSTLDELPNFWNVVKGDMALVGPRPEIPEMLQYYRKECLVKFCVKPGVTGLAQVSGRGRLLFRETEDLDVLAVQQCGVLNDVRIMFRTIYLILKKDGAF